MVQLKRPFDSPRDRRRPPLTLSVVRDPDFAEQVDWSSWYLTDEDDMAQAPKQVIASEVFKAVAQARAEELGMADAFISLDAFFAWVESEPLVRVSPDVYVLEKCPEPMPESFQTWRSGHVPPLLALEVVSSNWQKDYEDAPAKYAQLGVAELVIFDPWAVDHPDSKERCPIQVYRRSADGIFVRASTGNGPCFIESLRAWSVVARASGVPVLTLAYDEAGRDVVPTQTERVIIERDRERARRMELEALVARLQGGESPE